MTCTKTFCVKVKNKKLTWDTNKEKRGHRNCKNGDTDNWVSPWLSRHPNSQYSPTGSIVRDLMYGGPGGFHPVPGLRATSQNILMSTTKVNEACSSAPTSHETKVGISTDSPH